MSISATLAGPGWRPPRAAGRVRSPAEWALIVVGLSATVVVTGYVTRLARLAMRQQGTLSADEEAEPRVVAPSSPRRIAGTVLLAVVAAIVVGLAIALEFRPGLIRSAAAYFGAPPVAVLAFAGGHVSALGDPTLPPLEIRWFDSDWTLIAIENKTEERG